jgi:uncharacterized protein (DUF1778 family)
MIEGFHARMSLEERQLLEQAARKRGISFAEFAREAIIQRAAIELGA